MNYKKEIQVRELEVTPEAAAKILERSLNNRPVKKNIVNKYTIEMMMNKWLPGTGETIKFSDKNNFMDGQHRLLAVIESNTTQTFLAAFNLDENVFNVIDSGMMRNGKDVFSIARISYAKILPSILKSWYALKEKDIDEKYFDNKGKVIKKRTLTNAELLEEYNRRPEFWDSVATTSMTWYERMTKVISPMILGSLYAHFYEKNPTIAKKFFDDLTDGTKNDDIVIVTLRNKLIKDRLQTRKKLTHVAKVDLISTAWKKYTKNIFQNETAEVV